MASSNSVIGAFILVVLDGISSHYLLVPPVNQNLHGSQKIINGIDAEPGQFPFIVSLNNYGDGHTCAASILTESWFLTAAHCCKGTSKQYIYAGSIFLSTGGTNYTINQQIIHEDYDYYDHWANDICLIEIIGIVEMDGTNADQVVLAPPNFIVPDNSEVVIAGWGYTIPDYFEGFPDRQQVITDYYAYSVENCEKRSNITTSSGRLCAASENGHGVCQGDSGGPLMYNGTQVGITSFIFLPCASGRPDYFSRVPNYIDWIKQNMGNAASSVKIAAVDYYGNGDEKFLK